MGQASAEQQTTNGDEQHRSGVKGRSAGDGMLLVAGGKGRRKQPLASASERTGLTAREAFKTHVKTRGQKRPRFTLRSSLCAGKTSLHANRSRETLGGREGQRKRREERDGGGDLSPDHYAKLG